MGNLKLGKLPDRVPVKLTISISPELRRDLGDYARLYEEQYGEAESVAELVPAMLQAFLTSDRVFARRRGRAGSHRRSGVPD